MYAMKSKYSLEPYTDKNSRFPCPQCGKKQEFSRYMNTETEEYLAPHVGRCNNENKCGYHLTPRQYFQVNPTALALNQRSQTKKPVNEVKPNSISLIPMDVFKQSLKSYNNNNFIKFLSKMYDDETIKKVIRQYFIGTSKRWPGATVFYQVDATGKIRRGKIIQFNPETGNRVKVPKPLFYSAHIALKLPGNKPEECLFGEHLLRNEPDNTVAIVESEKTAVIASIHFPQFIWLAVGGLSKLKLIEKCLALKGRNIVLFPDLNGFERWTKEAEDLSSFARIMVSDILDRHATEENRKQGLDLGDYLLKFKLEKNCLVGNEKPGAIILTKLEIEKEYYHYPFAELIEAIGWESAIIKVKQYRRLSAQYKSSKTFVIHHCLLLTSYSNQSHYRQAS